MEKISKNFYKGKPIERIHTLNAMANSRQLFCTVKIEKDGI